MLLVTFDGSPKKHRTRRTVAVTAAAEAHLHP
jgi:hypothetical protein